jgi:hypothetical protein
MRFPEKLSTSTPLSSIDKNDEEMLDFQGFPRFCMFNYIGYTSLIMEHLIGSNEDCTNVIGLYPLLPDETCNFLVFDYDNHESKNQTD